MVLVGAAAELQAAKASVKATPIARWRRAGSEIIREESFSGYDEGHQIDGRYHELSSSITTALSETVVRGTRSREPGKVPSVIKHE
jgi:hypothetical protein